MDVLMTRYHTRGNQAYSTGPAHEFQALDRKGYKNILANLKKGEDGRLKEDCVDESLQNMIAAQVIRRNGQLLRREAVAVERIVLATGDGKPGELNPEGFFGAVTDALKAGFEVELWGWRGAMHHDFIALAEKEGSNFKLRYFDDVGIHRLRACNMID